MNNKINLKIKREEVEKSNIILNELKEFHKDILNIKTDMENKANHIITSCGIIITFVLALLAFMTGNDNNFIISPVSYLLIFTIMWLSVVCMILALNSIKVKNYIFPLGENPKKNIFLEEKVYDLKDITTSETLLLKLIEDYIFCSKLNVLQNERKTKSILLSQKLLTYTFVILAAGIITLLIPNF